MSASSLDNLRIVLCNTSHPGNIGAAARAMMTMNLSQLLLVNPERFPHAQARAQASGAVGILDSARVVATLEEAVADCGWVVATSARPRHLGDEPLTPWAFAEKALPLAADKPVALVFGTERTGLTNEELDRCQAVAMVPVNPKYSSLNLAQAVQIFCYELRRRAFPEVPKVSSKAESPDYAPPTAEEMEHFYAHLEKVLLGTGFLDPQNPRALMRRLRQFYNRAQPDRNELNMLRGILKSYEQTKRRRNARPEPEAGENHT
jgi:TrmH family RNA methyltransferase